MALFIWKKSKPRREHTDFNISSFKTVRINSINCERQPINTALSNDEMKTGCRLGIDSHADISCVNKHAFVESVMEGMIVDAILFDGSLERASNLSIVHDIYPIDNLVTFNTHLYKNM